MSRFNVPLHSITVPIYESAITYNVSIHTVNITVKFTVTVELIAKIL